MRSKLRRRWSRAGNSEGGATASLRGCPHSLCCRATFVLASSRASGEGESQGGVTTARQEGGLQGRCPRKERCQTAAPAKKVSKKSSPPKELSLKEQVIAQVTAAHTKKETLAAKRRALQVAKDDIKREKARSPLELLKKQRKEAGAGEEDICAAHPPGTLTRSRPRRPQNESATSATTFLKELQPKNRNHLRAQFSPMQETKAPVKKLEATQKEAEAANKPAAALPVAPTKVNTMEDSVSLFGGKPKAVDALVAKSTPSLGCLPLRPRQKGVCRQRRSQRRPHPQRPRSSRRQ